MFSSRQRPQVARRMPSAALGCSSDGKTSLQGDARGLQGGLDGETSASRERGSGVYSFHEMSAQRRYCIFTAGGERHFVAAPSLRTALRNFDERKSPVVAAIGTGCLPAAPAEDRPFVAVFLKSPHFVPPEGLE